MTSTRTSEPGPRPRSPWSGSRYETWHRWQRLVATRASRRRRAGTASGAASSTAPPPIPPVPPWRLRVVDEPAAPGCEVLDAVACARVGPNLDLVAAGSALRIHTVRDGALARTADAMAAAGGRLGESDDGFVQVRYGSTAC